MMTNTSAVADTRAEHTHWGLAAVAVVLCVLACAAARTDVEYVNFCDYYPLAVGNTWEVRMYCTSGSVAHLEVEDTEHFVVNGVDVWQREWRLVREDGPPFVYSQIDHFFLNGRLYSLGVVYNEELLGLPAVSEHMDIEYRQRYPIGVKVGSVTAYRGTLLEMLSLCHGVTVTNTEPLDSQLDAIALDWDSNPTQVFAYGIGLVDQSQDLSECYLTMMTPVTPILNEGCPNPLFLTSTNLGEVWEAGTVQTVTWQRDTEVAGPDIRIGLHKGAAFIEWIIRQTPNDGEYAWMIPPDLAPGDDYRLRIQSFTDNTIRDYSDGTFSITSPALALTVPNGGEALQAVDIQTIGWLGDDPAVGADVRLGLHRGATFVGWITRRTSNDGEFNWTIPDDLPAAANYRLRIQSFTDSAIRDFSDRRFAIVR